MNNFAAQMMAALVPLANMFAVVPSDSANLPTVTRSIYIESPGSVAFITAGGQAGSVNFSDGWHSVALAKILATNTTATGITGWY